MEILVELIFFFFSKIHFRKLNISKHVFSHLLMLGSGYNAMNKIEKSPCCQDYDVLEPRGAGQETINK